MSHGEHRLRRRTLSLGVGFAAAIVALAIFIAIGAPARPAAAQSAPSIVDTQFNILWNTEVTVSALVENGEVLESVVFFYTVLPEGAITRQVAEIVPGDVTRVTASIPTNQANTWIPAGSEIEWFWELTATGGEPVETPREVFRYQDPRYDWQEISDGNLTVFFYANENLARQMLNSGVEAIGTMSALLGIELDIPIRIYAWANPGDATGVERVQSEAFEELVVTGGTRVLADLLHVFQPTRWVVRHELTHVLTKIAGEGGIGQLPSWLDEGTATYAEGDWRSRRGQAINFAVDNDSLLAVRGMASVSNRPGEIDLFYGQSADLVTFLIDEFGEDDFAALFAVFKRGSTVDNALETVYGFNRDGLDDAYRAGLGLDPLVRGEDRSTTIEDEAPNPVGEATPQPSETAPSEAAPEQPDAEAEAVGAGRSDDDIAARQAEIDRQLENRRLRPLFTSSGGFPWEEVVTGVGAVGLVLGGILLWNLLGRAPSQVPATDGGAAGGAPDGSGSTALFWSPERPSDRAPSGASALSGSSVTADEPSPGRAASSEAPSSGETWSGWRRPDGAQDDAESERPDAE